MPTGQGGFPSVGQSLVVWKNEVAITNCLPTITASNSNYILELSNDGSTWEVATSGSTHTFAASAVTNYVKWRITGAGLDVTQVKIKVNV